MSTLVLPFPAINPILFQWGPLAIRWYALAYIAGLIAGWALIRRVVADDRLWGGAARPTPDSIDDLLVYCAIGVIVGGRLGNVLFYDPELLLLASARNPQGLGRRHGLPRRTDRSRSRRRCCSRAVTRRRFSACSISPRSPRRSASSSAGSPISSSRSCGAGRPTCPGRSSFPAPTDCRAIPARSTKPCSKGWRSSSSCRSRRARARCGGRA